MALSACHKRVPIAALPPAPSPATPSPAAAALDAADRAFSTGSFDEACRAYENYLRLNPSGEGRDQVLFRLGLSYVLRPSADWQRGMLSLRQVVETFPNSPFKAPASVILSLRSELDQLAANTQQRDQRIRQLAAELDRLKKIDAERRKRP
jgi:outer membrane protein assembly factor BamD (BamD/ComL family)